MAPVGKRGLQGRLEHRHAGVVDQGVHPSEVHHHLRRSLLHLIGLRDIAGQTQHPPGLAQSVAGGAQGGGVDVEQRHPVAVVQKPLAYGQPDAACAARDHCHRVRRCL